MILKVKCPKCNKTVVTKVTQEKRKKARVLKKELQKMYNEVQNCIIAHGDNYIEKYDKF